MLASGGRYFLLDVSFHDRQLQGVGMLTFGAILGGELFYQGLPQDCIL